MRNTNITRYEEYKNITAVGAHRLAVDGLSRCLLDDFKALELAVGQELRQQVDVELVVELVHCHAPLPVQWMSQEVDEGGQGGKGTLRLRARGRAAGGKSEG